AGEARWRKKLESLETNWQAKLEAIEEQCRELSKASGLLVPPVPPRSGLDLNKRSQALQMSRRGEAPQAIAAALTLPQSEVELLIKVQKIVLSGLGATSPRLAGR